MRKRKIHTTRNHRPHAAADDDVTHTILPWKTTNNNPVRENWSSLDPLHKLNWKKKHNGIGNNNNNNENWNDIDTNGYTKDSPYLALP